MKILTLDFEGSLKTGIREVGALYTIGGKMTSYQDIVIQNNEECIKALGHIVENKPDLFISHNIHIEKNLLKSYLPYNRKCSNTISLEWGPWIDTTIIYRTLYPNIATYDLSFLTKTFIKKRVEELSSIICSADKKFHHNALYDALCTFLLFERIQKIVNINEFIR
jgi:DNA polymerase III alpha subunit (gram-positive type)